MHKSIEMIISELNQTSSVGKWNTGKVAKFKLDEVYGQIERIFDDYVEPILENIDTGIEETESIALKIFIRDLTIGNHIYKS